MTDIPQTRAAGSDSSQLLPRPGTTHDDIVVGQDDQETALDVSDQDSAPAPEPLLGVVKKTSAVGAVVLVAIVLGLVHWKSPGLGITERILLSSFVVFSLGFAVLLLTFVVMAILGRINLAQALEDKPASTKTAGISLSRLQAFLWTLVILTTYFYQAVSNRAEGLPTVPPDLLMVMGISSAVYLTSKNMSAKKGPGG